MVNVGAVPVPLLAAVSVTSTVVVTPANSRTVASHPLVVLPQLATVIVLLVVSACVIGAESTVTLWLVPTAFVTVACCV